MCPDGLRPPSRYRRQRTLLSPPPVQGSITTALDPLRKTIRVAMLHLPFVGGGVRSLCVDRTRAPRVKTTD
jgi:hypothetical protein